MKSNAASLSAESIAAAIGELDAPTLRELAGRLCFEIARRDDAGGNADEVRRRAAFLAGRVESNPKSYGRMACPFCHRPSSTESALRKHLTRVHDVDLMLMDASTFKRGAA